jgi:diacylglycerol kinase (ATP)
MEDKTVGVIWNPSKIDEDALRAAVDAAFDGDVRWWATSKEDPGKGMAAEAIAEGCYIVIAVGCDGTIRAVAEALAGTDAMLGIVPQGTGNLLARNLDVPLENIPAALDRIATGVMREIDLGWVTIDGEERGFAVMVGFGVDAQMLVETDDDLKDRAGWLAYVEAMGRALAGSEMTTIRLTLDEEKTQELRAHTMLVGNCGMVQGGIRLLPDAVLDDGQLDLLLVSSDGPLQWLDTVRSVVWDNGIRRALTRDDKAVSTDSTTHLAAQLISVQLDEPRMFEIDGEEIGEVDSFEIRIQAGAVRVL